MCDPCAPYCDPCIPRGGYCPPTYLTKYNHASELVKYKVTAYTDHNGNQKDWSSVYRSNYRERDSAVCGIYPNTDANLTSSLGVALDYRVPECQACYVKVSVLVSGYNFKENPSGNVGDVGVNYTVKSYFGYEQINPILGVNVVVPFNGDLYKFNFGTSDPITMPIATTEITIDWYNTRC